MVFRPTLDQTKVLLGNNRQSAQWHAAFVKLFPEYGITTPVRVAGFLAQCGHESNGFRIREENLNYSAKRLNEVFYRYFAGAGRDAKDYAKKPEKIANLVYGDRMNNGPPSSGDGYRFRGRGPIQLTGRYNYTEFGKTIGKSAEETAEYMDTIEGALESALWFWKTNHINRYCDSRDIVGMTKRINGGTNGLRDRTERWDQALELFGIAEEAAPRAQVYKRGDRGGMVRRIQGALGITADGIFGSGTEAAVKRYQQRKGLTPDGVVGPATLRKMDITNG